MDTNKVKALVSLLDDEDWEVAMLVEKEIRNLGGEVIPFLENQWEDYENNPKLQQRIEELIHDMQLSATKSKLLDWKENAIGDLLKGMWAVATYQYPTLTYDDMKAQMQDLLFDAWLAIRPDMHPKDQIQALNSVFFDKYRFQSNTQQYHAIGNSFMNQVLESKKGNPISMCVIYMLMAQYVGMPVFGVNLPNIFILTYKMDGMQFYINVFNRGVTFQRDEIDSYIKQMHLEPRDSFYEPCNNEEIIKRVLRNLLLSFDKIENQDKIADIKQLLAVFD